MENDKATKEAQPKRGLWKPEEDLILKNYVETHGEGNWATVSKRSGLKRGGKSCRLRWKNYLRPNIKRGGMSKDEQDLIIRMHNLLGNRWSLIAGRLPGRTDNEVKNYWNTHLNKKNILGKRKSTTDSNKQHVENEENEEEDNKNIKKKPRQSHNSDHLIFSTSPKRRSDLDLDEKKQVMVQCFNYEYDNEMVENQVMMMMPNSNYSKFVLDEQHHPFTSYSDPFLLFEALGTDLDACLT